MPYLFSRSFFLDLLKAYESLFVNCETIHAAVRFILDTDFFFFFLSQNIKALVLSALRQVRKADSLQEEKYDIHYPTPYPSPKVIKKEEPGLRPGPPNPDHHITPPPLKSIPAPHHTQNTLPRQHTTFLQLYYLDHSFEKNYHHSLSRCCFVPA